MKTPRLLEGRTLRGANIHYQATVFTQRVELGPLAGLRSGDAGPDFGPRFIERFGGLKSLTPGGCLRETVQTALADGESGLDLAEMLLEGILAVERFVAGATWRLDGPRFSRIVRNGESAELVWECHAASISRAAARAGFAGVIELLPAGLRRRAPPGAGYATVMKALRRHCHRRRWAPTAAVLASAAKRRGIPHELLAGHYLRIGDGRVQHIVSEAALGFVQAPAEGWRDVPRTEPTARLLVVGGELVSALTPAPDGTFVDVTERVSSGIREAAVAAARCHEAAIVGVEVRTADLLRPGEPASVRVVPTKPLDLFRHALPGHGRIDQVCDAVLGLVFPAGTPARIPTALVVGDRGARTVARNLDRLLRAGGESSGLVTGHRRTISGRPIDSTSLGWRTGLQSLLTDPRVGTLISAVAPRGIVERGLRLDHVTATALLSPASGSDLDSYRAAVEVAMAATIGTIAFDTMNPCADRLLDGLDGPRMLVITPGRPHPVTDRCLAAGGTVVRRTAGPERFELQRGDSAIAVVPQPPSTGPTPLSGKRLERALFAAALAGALGLPAYEFVAPPTGADRAGQRPGRRLEPAMA